MEGGGGTKIRKIIFYLAMLWFLHLFIRNCDCGAKKINSSYGDVGFAPCEWFDQK
jgi:hypothetical protein